LGAAPAGAERIVPADPAVLQRALTAGRVERVPVPPQSSYLGELTQTLTRLFMDLLRLAGEKVHLPRQVLQAVPFVLAALVALLVARLIVTRMQRRPAEKKEQDVAEIGLAPVARSAAGWRAELERRLAEGRIAEALEALWWWLARSLAAGQVEPDWTSRDLVTRSRRDDLRDLVRRLDAFTYGPRRPAVEDLRLLVGRFEEALA
jgi:hypothetical protein